MVQTPEGWGSPESATFRTDAFFNSLEKVEFVKSVTPERSGSTRFYFRVGGKTGLIEIETDILSNGPGRFKSRFYSLFKCFPPAELLQKPTGGNNKWLDFLVYCGTFGVDVEPEDSTEYIEAGNLVEALAGLHVETDPALWGMKDTKRTLLKEVNGGKVTYLLKSSDISELLTDLRISTKIGALSTHLTGRHLKTQKTKCKRVTLSRGVYATVRAWEFTQEAIEPYITTEEDTEGE